MKPSDRAREALDGLPKIDLGTYPTPLDDADLRDVVPRFTGRAWIKREDLTAPELGGNKVRKLEYLLGAARSSGARTIVTVGGIGSNHCLATAFYAPRAGLDVHLALFPHHVTPSTRRTLRAICALGPRMAVAPGANSAGFLAAALAARLRLSGRRPAVLLPGGSSPTGVLGAVATGLELAGQLDEAPDAVYCAYGSGGTAAGIALGLQLAGLGSDVVAVRVYPALAASQRWLHLLARRARAILEQTAGRLPAFDARRLRVLDGYLGAGYADPTPEGLAAGESGAALGYTLEATYTAKAFAAFLDAAGGASRRSRLVFVLTYDPRIPSRLGHVPPRDRVPRALRQIVEDPD